MDQFVSFALHPYRMLCRSMSLFFYLLVIFSSVLLFGFVFLFVFVVVVRCRTFANWNIEIALSDCIRFSGDDVNHTRVRFMISETLSIAPLRLTLILEIFISKE